MGLPAGLLTSKFLLMDCSWSKLTRPLPIL
jgi:hypothetical protein